MSIAAAIPAILQIASGATSGIASMEENAQRKKDKRYLLGQAAQLNRLAAPLGRDLLSGYLPGGDLAKLLEARGKAEAEQELVDGRRASLRDAWRYGGPGHGRTAGYLSASPYTYLTAAASSRAQGRTEADKHLADIYLAGKNLQPIAESNTAEAWKAVSAALYDLSRTKY